MVQFGCGIFYNARNLTRIFYCDGEEMEEQRGGGSHTKSFIRVSQEIYETQKCASKVNVASTASEGKASNQQTDSCE
jgi:hypothetical protein